MHLRSLTVLIRGAGEAASAAAHVLHRSGLRVCMTEIPAPLVVCRGVAFAEAVAEGRKTVEGVEAELAPARAAEVRSVLERGRIAVVVDPETRILRALAPDVFVDAAMAKGGTATRIDDAPLVIGLGLGFRAGVDVHAVVETWHGDTLGRVILEGTTLENTGEPVSVGGMTGERVIWSPRAGRFETERSLGERVAAGDVVGSVDGDALRAPASGILRGLMRGGTPVPAGAKLVEVDPVHGRDACFAIRDKMRVIADGVLEAVRMRFGAP
jgi:xanthine dehydrogenase accessory factor